jgi:hypothetical protein
MFIYQTTETTSVCLISKFSTRKSFIFTSFETNEKRRKIDILIEKMENGCMEWLSGSLNLFFAPPSQNAR